MCLSKAHRFPRISWKPIKCYKLVCKENGKLYTPFRNVEIMLNKPIKPSRNLFNSLLCDTIGDTIEGGGVHAYINMRLAFVTMRYSNMLSNAVHSSDPCKVYEAIIPPFTFYWEGESNDIAARELIVTKEIENYE